MEDAIGELILRRATVSRGAYLHYSLHRGEGGGYHISVRRRGERAIALFVTEKRTRAEHLFRLVARGGVYPCHLREVLEDLLEEVE